MRSWIHRTAPLAAAFVFLATAATAWHAAARSPEGPAISVERGRYLARIAGCNDCHTPGYAQSGGRVAEKDWLVGDRVGWQGPWGTTYPANLRLAMTRLSEDEWVRLARTAQYRPPMPWFALRDMDEADLRSLHRFVRALGPAGEAVPAYVPPGLAARGPVIAFPAPPKEGAR